MAGRSSLCLYVRIGIYTLGSSCVQVYIQSHVRKDQGGALSKQAGIHTNWGGGGENHSQLELDRGWKKQKNKLIWNRSTQQVEGGKSPEEEPPLSFAIPPKKREQKRGQKGGEADRNAEGGTKKKILCTTKRFVIWTTGLQHCFPTSRERRKKIKIKKDSHQKTHASCTSQHTTFNPSHQTQFTWHLSVICLFYLNGTLLIYVITINWAGHVEQFRPVAEGSFVPRRVLLPFSLEEAAAPADRGGH